MGEKGAKKTTERKPDFSCVIDNFLAQTERIKRAAEKDLKNGDIVDLVGRVREQIGAISSTKNVFADMKGCEEAKKVVDSLESMIELLRQTRKQLPPVLCTKSRKVSAPREKKRKIKKPAN